MNINGISLYQQDFYGWTQGQVQALAQRQLSELDWQENSSLGETGISRVSKSSYCLVKVSPQMGISIRKAITQLVSANSRITSRH